MAALILLSGPCNSGKTTTLEALYNKLFSKGIRPIILNELIRQVTDKPIDELRKNAHEYLWLQEQIISEKIEQEKAALEDVHNEVWIADRAVTDSLYYLENYVDKTSLNKEDTKIFAKLHSRICKYLDKNFIKYNLVQLTPLKVIEQDIFRPKNLSSLQQYEYTCINRLNEYYSYISHNEILKIDLNAITQEKAIEQIIEFARL